MKEGKNFPEFNFTKGELLLVNKPYRWTSFDVVCKIRNALKPLRLKVGHAGTLDPLATGLLVVCTGKSTKKIDEYTAQDKEYIGTMCLGATTPSFDLETSVDNTFDIAHLTEEKILANCSRFLGKITQFPPVHSAIKIEGERAYMKARRGELVEMKPREVHISEFEITQIALPDVDFRVVCSKGTYVRSLVHDFGKALDCGAYLQNLTRTRSGSFHLKDAYELLELIDHIRQIDHSRQMEQPE